MTRKRDCLRRVVTFRSRNLHKRLAVMISLCLSGVSVAAAPAKAPKITLVYATAETSTSASVVWNTNTPSDSLVQYSTSNPIPGNATQVYVATPVTLHNVPVAGLTPGTLYFYKVTSCTKRGCVTATGSFETFPVCPDVVPLVSGTWQKVSSPNVSGSTLLNNELMGVAAVSDRSVWAVGWAQDPDPSYAKRTLIQHFDGNLWSIVRSPNPPNDILTELHSVSAASANDVWAVGSSHNGGPPVRTLIEHWDGTQWSIVSSPSPDTQLNVLNGVVALSANDAWAVGYRNGTRSETPLETLILHWDGTSWRQVASPNVGGANQLYGIAALSANDIWAVGSGGGAPLAMHWDGSAWSIVPTQIRSGFSTERFTAVSGSSSNDIWAVGQGKGTFSNRASATIWHWNGTRWTEKVCYAASASNPPEGYEGGGSETYFTGIAAVSSNNVWAVGANGSGPMILHWDGRAWTSVTHPRAYPNAAVLRAVATSSEGSAWSVGLEIEFDSSGSVSPQRTLIHKYTP